MKTASVHAIAFCILLLILFSAARAENGGNSELRIKRQGYLFAGGKYSTVNGKQVLSGQLYAEFQIPSRQTHPYPVVMVHGGGQSGSNFTGTPDGREGWAQHFLRQGYAVYVVDQVGRGRTAYQPGVYGAATTPDSENIQQRFTSVERYKMWPTAHLHTQWPGKGSPGDPIFDQFYASQLPSIQDFTLQQQLNRDAIIALLDKIGPAILMTHSQSGAFGWPVADARPDLVKAILAIEPSGPPFVQADNIGAPDWFRDGAKQRAWGVSDDPLTYSPPAASASDIAIEQQPQPDGSGLVRCWLQKSPARQLPNLQHIPTLIVTAEASYHAAYDHCTLKYLQQAGVRAVAIQLADEGIHGNGHMMMLEKNNLEIAAELTRWLDKIYPPGKRKQR